MDYNVGFLKADSFSIQRLHWKYTYLSELLTLIQFFGVRADPAKIEILTLR